MSRAVEKNCCLCRENLQAKYGFRASTVPLFCATTNKEFCSSFGGKAVILSQLLRDIGIFVQHQDERGSVCKRCARKIVNCWKTYSEIGSVFQSSTSTAHTPQGITYKRLPASRTPTGITPQSKRLKAKVASDGNSPTSKKQLFSDLPSCASEEYGIVGDHIANLMNLPVTESGERQSRTTPPIVKVFVGYPASTRVLERSCEDKYESILVKSLCKENYHQAAYAALNFPPLRRELVKELTKLIKGEMRNYSKGPSPLKYNGDPLSLKDYSNEDLLEEAEENLPILSIIKGSVKSGVKFLINKQALTIFAFLNTWMPRSNFIHRINSLLTSGGCKNEEMDLLHRLGLCSHPNTIRNQLQTCAEHFDRQIVKWKYEVEENRKAIKLLEEVLQSQTGSFTEDGMDLCSIDFTLENIMKYKYFNPDTYEKCSALLSGSVHLLDSDIVEALAKLKNEQLPRYRIVGDNVDLVMSARIQSHKTPNKTLHWFNEYAVKDRVSPEIYPPSINHCPSMETPQKSLDELEMKEFLLTPEVQAEIIGDLKPLIARVLVDYLPAYRSFNSAIDRHISHAYSEQMAEKSEVCCLGLDLYNSNKAAEMALILKNIQEQFVPTANIGDEKEILEKVILDGDKLTEERARNVQVANLMADSEYEQINGLQTSFADWHLGKNLLMIFFKLFVSEGSAAEVGTSYASMNRTGKTNARKGPDKDYNSYKEFFERETEGHIVACWMTFTGMRNMDDNPTKRPIPPQSASWSEQQKYSWLASEVESFVTNEVIRPNDIPPKIVQLDAQHREGFKCRGEGCEAYFPLHSRRVRHEITHHPDLVNLHQVDNGDHDRDTFGYYRCRQAGCFLVFTTNPTRQRHERVQHQLQYNTEEEAISDDKKDDKSDRIFNYHSARLQSGLLFYNLIDAIKEGDGLRVVRCYKVILLFEYQFHHTKYAYVILHFFANIYSLLSERQSSLLIHNRFVNKKGGKGGNVPLDLHMEHLNLDLKKLLKSMGGNITEEAAQRCARSLTVLNQIMNSVYEGCGRKYNRGYHGNKQQRESVETIANDLLQGNVFQYSPGREPYNSFKKFKKNIICFDYRNFFSWARDHFKKWKAIYQTPNNIQRNP